MSFPYPIGQPPLNATAEDPSSPFYGVDPQPPVLRAKSFADGFNGRICARTGVWVPASQLKWFRNRPYWNKRTPTEPIYPPDPPQGMTNP